MFNSVRIERFRGINRADISGFRLVNLFFGKNNCGKSSLLEAIFLACGQSCWLPLQAFSASLP